MKTTKIKASVFNAIFLSAIIFGTASCDNHEDKTADNTAHTESKTEEVAKDQNEAKFDDNDDEKNAKFLVKAAEINLEEISLGKLAQDKSTNADVKGLAKMMVTAHEKSFTDLKGLAGKKGISIPTENTQDVIDANNKLSEKTEQNDFNKAYVDKMVEGHKNAVDLFEKHSTESSDADIKAWATSALPELRKHLDHSIAVQKKLENK